MAVKRRTPRGHVHKKPKVKKKRRKHVENDPKVNPHNVVPHNVVPEKVIPERVVPVTPGIKDPIPCPWSQRQLAGIIERACRFIADAKQKLGRDLGIVVGRYLYLEVYRRDIAYIRLNDPGKDDSLRDIAGQSGVPYRTLHEWLMAGYVHVTLEEAGIDPRLGIKHLKEIATLGDDVEVMVEIAKWAQEMRVTSREMPGIVDRWREHLDEGGKLEDLVRFPKKRKKRKKRKRKARTEDLVVPRIIEFVTAWVKKIKLSPAYRRRVRQMALGLRARLTGEAP